ncbi:MAG: hypothetical protein ACP5G0_08890 [Desulfomonilia bacterium]
MLRSRGMWYLMMAGALAGWVFAISGLVKPYEPPAINTASKIVLLIWVLGHPLELPISMGIARQAGLSPLRAILKTILYGFTWWLPLKLGVIKK